MVTEVGTTFAIYVVAVAMVITLVSGAFCLGWIIGARNFIKAIEEYAAINIKDQEELGPFLLQFRRILRNISRLT